MPSSFKIVIAKSGTVLLRRTSLNDPVFSVIGISASTVRLLIKFEFINRASKFMVLIVCMTQFVNDIL